jgi:hypothetical protein
MQNPRFRRFWWLYVILVMVCLAVCGVAAFVQLASTEIPPSSALDPDQRWATQIIAGATMTAEAINNPILRLWGSVRSVLFPPPPSPTRPRGIVNYPTSVPTLTSIELQQLHSQWLTDIETAVGFSYPLFEEAIDDFFQFSDPDYIANMQRQPPEIARTTFQNDEYVAVAPMPSLYPPSDAGQFLLFRVTDDVPSLIFQGDALDYDLTTVDLNDEGFTDYNGNGYPDIVLYATLGVTCAQPIFLRLLEIREGGEVVDITPETDFNQYQTARGIDLDRDDIIEIEVIERFNTLYRIGGSCNFVNINRYFAWDGTAYRDISATLDESYYPATQMFWESVEAAGACLLPSPLMYEMLLSEYVRSNLVDAWGRLQPRLRWSECSRDIIMQHNWEMRGLEEWIVDYLPPATATP